jgi:hypothetical protein
MRMASRLFLVSADDTLHLLASAAFMRMLRQEDVARMPNFAGQRVRQASLIVEMFDLNPLRVLHRSFSILDVGADGRLDVERWNSQQMARMGDPLAPVLRTPTTGTPVVDAASRFIARGGSWAPDDRLLRQIEAAALGCLACRRVRVVR